MPEQKRRDSVTAAELIRKLESDPDWIARRKAQEHASEVLTARFRAEERTLVDDLASAGVQVSSVIQLVNTSAKYPNAIPVLMKHFRLPYSDALRESIVRALTTEESRGKVSPHLLLDEFKRLPTPMSETSLKWLLGNAIVGLADDSCFDEIAAVLRDHSHGKTRSQLPLAMTWMRKKREDAVELLIELLNDEDPGTQYTSIQALGHIGSAKAIPFLNRLLNHSDSYVRNLTGQALAKIDRSKRS